MGKTVDCLAMCARRMALAVTLCALLLGHATCALAAEEVTVFAAASLTNAITELGQKYEAMGKPKVVPSFASTSTLAKQIENGAPAQVFLSADLEWMDYLAARKLIVLGSRVDLVGNRLVVIAPRDSTMKVDIKPGFDLVKLLSGGRLAVGNPDHVPVGKYAKAALEKLGVWKDVADKMAAADNVRAGLALVERGEAPLGVVYATDAAITKKVKVVGVFPEDTHPPIVYPAALVAEGDTPAGREFLKFLQGPEAKAVFEKFGFTVR